MNLNFSKKITASLLTLCMVLSSVPAIWAADTVPAPENGGQSSAVDVGDVQATDNGSATSNRDLIEHANSLANAPYTYYTTDARDEVTIKNNNMSLAYGLHGNTDAMYVSKLSNTSGNSYVTNTMDVFLETTSGTRHYASKSINSASLNIYRFGYYYYENRIEGQVFISDITAASSYDITLSSPPTKNDITVTSSGSGKLAYTTNSGATDPYFGYNLGSKIGSWWVKEPPKAADYDFVEITAKITDGGSNGMIYLAVGSAASYNDDQNKTFPIISDGEYHTYQIPLSDIQDYTGNITGVRFDISGTVEISSIRLFKSSITGIDASLSMQRSFLTYSDKLHHLAQLSTVNTITDVANVGMETKIDANTVSQLVVKDAEGQHTSLDGVDWTTAEYIGFDIAGVGIFGYILPADDASGSMTVTLADGIYTITQILPIAGNTISPSEEGTENANDIFFGQRIYTDENHDFADFLNEAEAERNPLTDENFLVDVGDSGASFVGYDALHGFYRFALNGTGFNQAYFESPNKQYNVRFTVTGDEYDRTPYILTRATNTGSIECATLLDENNMLLPVPLEVCKNFCGDGEANVYNIDDPLYSDVFFPIIVNAEETRTYNVLNLYQNWGKVPLTQISSIQFHTPYYHLSTGVTETNCIVPYAINGPTLPDHRTMSAPFWRTQPQHNSGGSHTFMAYTDADGNTVNSQNTTGSIDSYGPTYCDLTLGMESYDGKITATYTHTEFPQTDENRAFYEMKYTFNEDISFDDFAHDFRFYRVTDNDAKATYEKVGYLDANNVSQVVDAATSGNTNSYVLGDESPYFSFFMMSNWTQSDWVEGYTNVSMLFKDWSITVNGQEIDADLIIVNTYPYIQVSFNLTEVNFKAGDTIKINAIIMPWGSQEMEDDEANRLGADHVADYSSTCPHYSDELEDGSLYMDKNVRDVRVNTLLNPLTATAVENCTVLESPFVPKVKSTNGESATFTLTGGQNNVATRVYGFDKLTVPYIEELVDGEWVEYEVNSASAVDQAGYGHDYDGYMVHYDDDGSYSYSFVVPMDYTDADGRTFRVSASEDFEGWDYTAPTQDVALMNHYYDAEYIYSKVSTYDTMFGSSTALSEDESYVRLYADGTSTEAFLSLFTNVNNFNSGKYIVYKYRIPEGTSVGSVQFWSSTELNNPTEGSNLSISGNAVVADGNWHVMVIDMTTLKTATTVFSPDDMGMYDARHLRIDFWNTTLSADSYVDVAYVGMSDHLDEILAANTDIASVDLLTATNAYTSVSTKRELGESAPTLTIESAIVSRGEEFTVSLNIANNPGLSYLKLVLEFDSEALTLKSVSNGEIISSLNVLDGYLTWSDKKNCTDNGSLAEFTFVVNENATVGSSYDVDFVIVDGNGYDGAEFNANTVGSKITITAESSQYGHINDDDTIDLGDVFMLREYLANYDYENNLPAFEIASGADVNGDGKIDSNDLTLLRQYLANYDYSKGTSSVVLGRGN